MMLDARERRQAIQNRLLNEHKAPLVCLTMNIAGDIKDTPAIRYAFLHGVSEIRSSLGAPVAYETLGGATGCEAFFVYRGDAADIKNRTVEIESSPPTVKSYRAGQSAAASSAVGLLPYAREAARTDLTEYARSHFRILPILSHRVLPAWHARHFTMRYISHRNRGLSTKTTTARIKTWIYRCLSGAPRA